MSRLDLVAKVVHTEQILSAVAVGSHSRPFKNIRVCIQIDNMSPEILTRGSKMIQDFWPYFPSKRCTACSAAHRGPGAQQAGEMAKPLSPCWASMRTSVEPPESTL